MCNSIILDTTYIAIIRIPNVDVINLFVYSIWPKYQTTDFGNFKVKNQLAFALTPITIKIIINCANLGARSPRSSASWYAYIYVYIITYRIKRVRTYYVRVCLVVPGMHNGRKYNLVQRKFSATRIVWIFFARVGRT